MKQHIPPFRQILSAALTSNLRGVRRFGYGTATLTCALMLLLLFAAGGLAQTQQPPDALTITKEGNVGVGTTSPNRTLDVNGVVALPGHLDQRGQLLFGNLDANTTPWMTFPAGPNTLYFRPEGSGKWSFFSDGTGGNVLTMSADGNVGIGTSAPANKLSVLGNADFSGNVGIGTTNPVAAKLQVAGGASTALRLDANAGVAALNIGGTGQLVVDSPGVAGGRFIVDDNGNVGIGGAYTARAKVGIFGSVGSTLAGTSGYLGSFPNTNVGNVALPVALLNPNNTMNPLNTLVSLFASNDILASGFRAFSDARIKRIEGRSVTARDLATLLRLEVTDYSYIDSVSQGTGVQKKIIGQQVEKVFPQAVSRSTDIVPDIYQLAMIKDGWVMLATNLKKGERVRLIGEKQEGIHEVLEVAEGRFRTAFAADGGQVFVYGREVNDALSVDYEAISMLNVSATQELAKRLEKLEAREPQAATLDQKNAEVKALQDENAALRSRLAQQEKRLAAIEARLLSADKPAAHTASLKKLN
jgi:hypothetical protein